MDEATGDRPGAVLTHTRDLFGLALEAAPTGMLLTDRSGVITYANAQVERMFGYSKSELVGGSLERLVPERFRGRHPLFREEFFRWPQIRPMGAGRDLFGLRRDGSEIPVEIGLTPVNTAEGDFVLSSIVDITERRRSEDQFRLALEAAPTGMLMIDGRGCITLVNAQIEALFGYVREELIGRTVEMLVPERLRPQHAGSRQSFFAAPQTRAMGAGRDLYGRRKDGSEVPVEIGLTPLETAAGTFVLSSIVDITERRRALEQLRERTNALSASLRERDVLLQEVHHRVKNNLQVISSLINMQVRKLEGGMAREVLAECKSRVEAIALIHEKLYQSRDYARVPFSDYARTLVNNIVRATDASGAGSNVEVKCDPLSLPVDKAISCGLILNELITNALKHAYPGGSGPLRIELHRADDGCARLSVSDQGVGIPARPPMPARSSLGLQLVNTLTEQLNGKLSIDQHGGTSVTVEFPIEG